MHQLIHQKIQHEQRLVVRPHPHLFIPLPNLKLPPAIVRLRTTHRRQRRAQYIHQLPHVPFRLPSLAVHRQQPMSIPTPLVQVRQQPEMVQKQLPLRLQHHQLGPRPLRSQGPVRTPRACASGCIRGTLPPPTARVGDGCLTRANHLAVFLGRFTCTLPLLHVNPYRRYQSTPVFVVTGRLPRTGNPRRHRRPSRRSRWFGYLRPPWCSARSSLRGLGRRTEPRDEPADPPHDVGMTDHTAIADNPSPPRTIPPRADTTTRPGPPSAPATLATGPPAHALPPRHPHPRRPTEQPQGHRPRPPPRRAPRRHRGQRLRQVVARLRHRLQRRPAPLRRDLLLLRPPVPRPYGQAPRGRHRRHPPSHRHRPDQPGTDLAFHRRHHDRAQRPSEAAVRPRRGPALPGLRGAGAPRHAGVHPGRAARRRSRPGDGDLRGEGSGGVLPGRAGRAAGEPGLHPGAPRAPGPHRGHPGPLPARRWRGRPLRRKRPPRRTNALPRRECPFRRAGSFRGADQFRREHPFHRERPLRWTNSFR